MARQRPPKPRPQAGKKSMKPGGGGRFAKMVQKVKSKALAAWIGRRKWGAKRMARWSAKGRRRAGLARRRQRRS